MSEASDAEADLVLKSRHRAMWALGSYPTVATDLISALGATLVRACDVRAGQRVLDVAAGAGNAAIPAAAAGADVVACDLTPELLEAGRRAAERQAWKLEWREADAESLPFGDAEFDTVMSCVGIMFAPHHRAAADELLRVCRPGGTIGLLNWTPEGFIGQNLALMSGFTPPPPPGALPPPLWGRPEHVRDLLGDRVTDLVERRETVRVDRFRRPEDFATYFRTHFGPTIAAYRGLTESPDRVADLDQALADLVRRHDRGTGDGDIVMEWEYLLVTARKR